MVICASWMMWTLAFIIRKTRHLCTFPGASAPIQLPTLVPGSILPSVYFNFSFQRIYLNSAGSSGGHAYQRVSVWSGCVWMTLELYCVVVGKGAAGWQHVSLLTQLLGWLLWCSTCEVFSSSLLPLSRSRINRPAFRHPFSKRVPCLNICCLGSRWQVFCLPWVLVNYLAF